VIILDEKGKQFTSREFAQKIDNWMNSSVKKIHILIGGAYGFSEEIYSRANEKMSLSKMIYAPDDPIIHCGTIVSCRPDLQGNLIIMIK
jgi:23S rRNA pseudoU1915 N3-methylase RlmH